MKEVVTVPKNVISNVNVIAIIKKRKMTINLFVCDKVEFMTLPNFKTFKCSRCSALIGMTKAGYERYLKIKNIKAICHECFWKYKEKVKIKTMNKKQMEELKNIFQI